MKALARITLVTLLVISFGVTIYADDFDNGAVGQKEEYGFFDATEIVLFGFPILVLLAVLVLLNLFEGQCTKCRNFFARKLIAKTTLEIGLYKYKYRCKYCGYELEKIEEDIYVGP